MRADWTQPLSVIRPMILVHILPIRLNDLETVLGNLSTSASSLLIASMRTSVVIFPCLPRSQSSPLDLPITSATLVINGERFSITDLSSSPSSFPLANAWLSCKVTLEASWVVTPYSCIVAVSFSTAASASSNVRGVFCQNLKVVLAIWSMLAPSLWATSNAFSKFCGPSIA